MPISGILVPMLGTLSLQGGGRDPLFLGGGPHLVEQPFVIEVVEAQEAVEAAGGNEGQRGVTLQPPHAARNPLQALQQPPWGGRGG